MDHPPAPWLLVGEALAIPTVLRTGAVRSLLPRRVRIVRVLPRSAAGVLFLGRYGAGSTLTYHELIVAPAVVRAGFRIAAWISDIYVDDVRSRAGGREIWGVPKELAEFAWEDEGDDVAIDVTRGGRTVCSVRFRGGALLPRMLRPRLPVWMPAFGSRGDRLLWFQGTGTARLLPGRARVEIPAASPLPPLAFGGGAVRLSGLRLRVRAPRSAGE